jgi:hypothetical protein
MFTRPLALCLFATLPALASADWLFAPAKYTHSPATGQRIAQYAQHEPVEGLPDYRDTLSRYWTTRTQLRGVDGALDSVYEVRSFGNGRGGLDAQWERGFDAWQRAANIAGPFWAGAYWPGGIAAPGLDYYNQGGPQVGGAGAAFPPGFGGHGPGPMMGPGGMGPGGGMHPGAAPPGMGGPGMGGPGMGGPGWHGGFPGGGFPGGWGGGGFPGGWGGGGWGGGFPGGWGSAGWGGGWCGPGFGGFFPTPGCGPFLPFNYFGGGGVPFGVSPFGFGFPPYAAFQQRPQPLPYHHGR